MKLKDWSPFKECSWINKGTLRHLDKEIKMEYGQFECKRRLEEELGHTLPDTDDSGWDKYMELLPKTTFTHKNLYSFVELEDGTLIGWNESPSHGWSFPVGKWRKE